MNFESRAPRMRHLPQQRRRRAPHRGLDGREPDVGDDDLAGVEAPGRDVEPDLARVEGDRERRVDGRAGDLAGRRVDAGGEVDGDDRQPAGVDPLDHRRRLGSRSTVEAGAEEGVDHDVAALDRVGLDGLAARLAEHAGGDPAVAAVRATAADDGEPARVRDTRASPRRRRRRLPAPSGRAPSPGSRGTPPRRPASRPRCRAPRTPSRSWISARAARRRRRPPSCGSGSARRRSRACRPARHIPPCGR